MKSSATRLMYLSALIVSVVTSGAAQQVPPVGTIDQRVGLKAGFRDAGEAARNMEHIATLPKPEGFFDPTAPAGRGSPPESANPQAPANPAQPPPFDPVASNRLAYTNSDLAFTGNHVIVGSYHGFNTYDVERPNNPKLLGSVVCPGGQGDVSVHGHLLFMSVEQTRGRLDCGTQGIQEKVSVERFRGIRIFDIGDINKPKQLAAIQPCRGSHTHTVVTDLNDRANLYV